MKFLFYISSICKILLYNTKSKQVLICKKQLFFAVQLSTTWSIWSLYQQINMKNWYEQKLFCNSKDQFQKKLFSSQIHPHQHHLLFVYQSYIPNHLKLHLKISPIGITVPSAGKLHYKFSAHWLVLSILNQSKSTET